jgi:hypothetical protein
MKRSSPATSSGRPSRPRSPRRSFALSSPHQWFCATYRLAEGRSGRREAMRNSARRPSRGRGEPPARRHRRGHGRRGRSGSRKRDRAGVAAQPVARIRGGTGSRNTRVPSRTIRSRGLMGSRSATTRNGEPPGCDRALAVSVCGTILVAAARAPSKRSGRGRRERHGARIDGRTRGAMIVMTSTALTGATYDVDGGQQIVSRLGG